MRMICYTGYIDPYFSHMRYLHTKELRFPLNNYVVNALGFGERGTYAGVDWGIHLGDDILVSAGTSVVAAGRGRVVYAALHPGTAEHGNWGNVMIIVHKDPIRKMIFYTLYGHLGEMHKKEGERVQIGEEIGTIGTAYTRDNGWWPAHLHFGIYTGPWEKKILPGYFKEAQKRTDMMHWQDPSTFIVGYR